VKPVRKTYTTSSAVGGQKMKVHAGADVKPAGEDAWSVEAISLRASYVGPVLQDILHKMENNWHENQDLEP
jgi:hypothetical protein